MPESKPAVSESRERFLQEIFSRHFSDGVVGVWEFGEEVERETREQCAQIAREIIHEGTPHVNPITSTVWLADRVAEAIRKGKV